MQTMTSFAEHQSGKPWSVKMLITLEPLGIFLLHFAYLYILRMSLADQIPLNNKRQQELCRSKQSYFYH